MSRFLPVSLRWFQIKFLLGLYMQLKRNIRKVEPETRYFSWDPRPMTHLMHGWDPVPEIRDPKGGTRDPGPSSLVGPGTRDLKGGTQDPGHLFYMGPKIQDPGHWKKFEVWSLICIYPKHVNTSLGNFCTHLPYVFWFQTNSAKFKGNHRCQNVVFFI